jgi:hypothetical protein
MNVFGDKMFPYESFPYPYEQYNGSVGGGEYTTKTSP